MFHLSGSPRLSRAIGLTAVPALALSSLAALTSAPAQAAEPDPAPVAAGTTWLKGQLTDGLVFNPNFGGFNDYGLSVDVALALDEVGGEAATIDAISTALAAEIAGYVGDGTTESYAGSLAKAAVLAQTAGDDPESFGGVDLIDRLEQRVSDSGVTIGRIQDASAFGNFANTFGQTFAARALDAEGSSEAEAATEFLIAQQCDAGFFRQDFAALDAADQDCDADPSAAPSTDVTALAVLALLPQADDTDVQAVIDLAVTWLLDQQGPRGGSRPALTSRSPMPTAPASPAGPSEQPEKNSPRRRRPSSCGCSRSTSRRPARAPSTTSMERLPTTSWRWSPAGRTASRLSNRTSGDAPRRRRFPYCFGRLTDPLVQERFSHRLPPVPPARRQGGRIGGRPDARRDRVFHAPRRGGRFRRGRPRRYRPRHGDVASGDGAPHVRLDGRRTGGRRSMTFSVLDAKRIPVELKARVPRGKRQVVQIRGLAEFEEYRVKVNRKLVDDGRANAKGRAVVRFAVGRKTGVVKVVVLGEFKNRRATKAFTVTR